jgi:diacylglycerol kinase (ATP)
MVESRMLTENSTELRKVFTGGAKIQVKSESLTGVIMPTAYIAYNPSAGSFPSTKMANRAAKLLNRYGWELELKQTNNGEHITLLAREAAAKGLDAFFVVGGDGSANLAVNGLVGSQTALGVLPGGTANVWSQELGLSGLTWNRDAALDESAIQLGQGEVRLADVGRCNERVFLLWAGIGLDAYVVHRIEPRERWEKQFAIFQYAASALWNAGFWHGINLQVEVDGKKLSGQFLLAVVSNIHLYAGGLAELSPQARLDDGLLDLWLFMGETMGDTLQIAWDLLAGRHHQSDRVLHYPFRSVLLKSDSEMFVQVDGEPLPAAGPVEIKVVPQALRVLVPPNTPHRLFDHQVVPNLRKNE